MKRAGWAWVGLMFFCACKLRTVPAAGEDAGKASVPIATVAPVPKGPRMIHVASAADMGKDELAECVDFDLEVPPEFDQTKLLDAGPAFDPELMKGLTSLSKPCGEQFADRTPMAFCTLTRKAEQGQGVTVHMTSRAYLFADVALSDWRMKECLESKGDWKALARGSAEWKAAERAYALRNLHKDSDRLRKLSNQAAE